MFHSFVDLYHAIDSYLVYFGGLIVVAAVQLTKPDSADARIALAADAGNTGELFRVVGNHIFFLDYPLVEVLQTGALVVALTGGFIKLLIDLSPKLVKAYLWLRRSK